MQSRSRWQRLIRQLIKVVVLASAIAAAVYWFRFSPVAVETYTVERGMITAEVMGTGTLEARVETTICPRISGRIVEVLVDQGNRVSSGDLLVRLDDDELQQQVAIAQANLEAASAAIVRLTTDKNRATAVYDQAQKSYDRTQTLLEQKAISREEADKATKAWRSRRPACREPKRLLPKGRRNWSPRKRRWSIIGHG